MYTTTLNINIVPGGPPTYIHISQKDAGLREYTFVPYSNIGNLDLSSASEVTLEATKPDGYAVMNTCTWTGSVIKYVVQPQLAAAAGNVWSKLYIKDSDGNNLGTAAIVWIVDKAGINDDAVVSDSDLSALEEAIAEFEDLETLEEHIEAAYGAIPYYTSSNEALNFDVTG